MTVPEILICLFFLMALFIPRRTWSQRWKEFKSTFVFALVFPVAMQPIWSYDPNSWSFYISHTPVFIMLYWLAFLSFAINISDRIARWIRIRKTGDASHWVCLLSDVLLFGLIGIIWETVFFHLGSLDYRMGTAFGLLGLIKIPLILLLGYMGLAIFGGQTFRLKKKAGVL